MDTVLVDMTKADRSEASLDTVPFTIVFLSYRTNFKTSQFTEPRHLLPLQMGLV